MLLISLQFSKIKFNITSHYPNPDHLHVTMHCIEGSTQNIRNLESYHSGSHKFFIGNAYNTYILNDLCYSVIYQKYVLSNI